MKRVYVAGPITKGDQFRNIWNGVLAGEQLLRAGYAPYVPHLNYTWHMMWPHDTAQWYALDNEWLRLCDALVRLPGDSDGADAETELAYRLNIPVYFGVAEFLADELQEVEA